MSANTDYSKWNMGLAIEDFMNNGIFSLHTDDTSILNMCLTNGTMGRPDQLKLRELYPGLFDAVQKFLALKNRGKVFIYEEEGKPKVVNVFIHTDPKNNQGVYSDRKSARKSLGAYVLNGKIPSKEFVWIYSEDGKHKKMIEEALKYNLNYSYRLIALKREIPEARQEEETDF